VKINVVSNAPFLKTGYGIQTAQLVRHLSAAGHEVTISSPYSFYGNTFQWEGMTVLPGGLDAFGSDILDAHYRYCGAELMITLCDVFAMDAVKLKGLNVAHWIPVDCAPLGALDKLRLKQSGGVPIAFSRFGETRLREAGFDPHYVPHGIDTRMFAPAADRDELRDAMGISANTFLIGTCGINKDSGNRKALPEQMTAFAKFHRRHPNSMLVIHSVVNAKPIGGVNLKTIAESLGVADKVMFPDQHAYVSGLIGDDTMAEWFQCLDLYSGCSLAEGFGLPSLEAQACGTPVVVTDGSAMSELCGSGWKVQAEPHWSTGHEAWWMRPSCKGILDAYEEAYAEWPGNEARRKQAREFALQYDADQVFEEYWLPVLNDLETMVARRSGGRPLECAERLQAEYEARWATPSDMQHYMPVLRETAAAYPQVRVTELGVRTGHSTCAFLTAADAVDGHVWSVDVEQPDIPPYWSGIGRWELQLADDMSDLVEPRPCDVLFIDTSHEYEHTLGELRKFVPSVAPGGTVLCHDTLNWPGDTVVRALNDFCAETGLTWEEIGHGRYGLGRIKIGAGLPVAAQ
jgi:glycosyltransferase involved in cell wall biosynthesis/predicted O-methyltransferase YrrM